MISIVSESYFNNSPSIYAQSLRENFGKNYQAYVNSAKKNTENTVKEISQKYCEEKKTQYESAVENLKNCKEIWKNYEKTYTQNLKKAKKKNNDKDLNAYEQLVILTRSGNGALPAYTNLKKAEDEMNYYLSLYENAANNCIFVTA